MKVKTSAMMMTEVGNDGIYSANEKRVKFLTLKYSVRHCKERVCNAFYFYKLLFTLHPQLYTMTQIIVSINLNRDNVVKYMKKNCLETKLPIPPTVLLF